MSESEEGTSNVTGLMVNGKSWGATEVSIGGRAAELLYNRLSQIPEDQSEFYKMIEYTKQGDDVFCRKDVRSSGEIEYMCYFDEIDPSGKKVQRRH